MRRIVCFGDSNTYGQSPVDGSRYGEDVRWPGVLNSLLGEGFEVVNEGKSGRTIAFDDPYIEGCNGIEDIGECLDRNQPIDLLIIMLGTNDLKVYFESTPQMIADNLRKMCEIVKEKTDAKLLLVSPMLLGDQIEFSPLHLEFGREQVDYSFELAPQIEKVAEEVGSEFIDLAVVAMSSDVDCLHLMPEEHAKVAQAMEAKVLSVFKEELEQEAREQEELRRQEEEEAARKLAEEQEEAARKLAEEQDEAPGQQEQEEAVGILSAQSEEIAGLSGDIEESQSDLLFGQIEEIQRKAKAILGSDDEVQKVEIPEEDEPEEGGIQFQALMREVVGRKEPEEEPVVVRPPELDTVAVSMEEAAPDIMIRATAVNERDYLNSGKLYRRDDGLKETREQARILTEDYNKTGYRDTGRRQQILASLFQYVGRDCGVEPPFRCEYGFNITVGDNFYADFGCVLQDAAKITIGNHVFLGSGVSIFTAGYPVYAPIRNENLEYAKDVTIGDDVWIGGNVTINPGVHIGSNVVIGSGSVVTGDIPDGVMAAGNPCRIIRKISESDKQFWEEKKEEREE